VIITKRSRTMGGKKRKKRCDTNGHGGGGGKTHKDAVPEISSGNQLFTSARKEEPEGFVDINARDF
ncbi:hypothetical protein NECAME_12194, partial [Necator americanus]